MHTDADRHRVDDFLIRSERAMCLSGLDEESVAMIFALYSRNPRNLRDTLIHMVDEGHLVLPEESPKEAGERVRRFHERMTIGYGHKSVADHAQVHWAVEGVSTILERSFLSARLLAATSVSTRYVDFWKQGVVTPPNWPLALTDWYLDHCNQLIEAYSGLVDVATIAVREIVPYDDEAKEIWDTERKWVIATSKRGLDLVRDLLPAGARTSFGVTMSATGLREFLDKHQSGTSLEERTISEMSEVASELRIACRSSMPALIPEEPRDVPRHRPLNDAWVPMNQRVWRTQSVEIVSSPDWTMVLDIFKLSPVDLVRRWREDRCHKMGPDRSSEMLRYVINGWMPFAIARDLGRHRMMTQLWSIVSPGHGYGCDPLMHHPKHRNLPAVEVLRAAHRQALLAADRRIFEIAPRVGKEALQYACPLATMVRGVWEVSLRQLVYILGLRTVPQGHAGYRAWCQALAKAVIQRDPGLKPLIDDVTNWETYVAGRPG